MKQLVDIQTVADALGVKVSTVYGMVSRREIPFTKVGRLTKFDPAAIDAWLEHHTFSPVRPPAMSLRKVSQTS